MQDRRWIEGHIPHQGTMCLLDEVLWWDGHNIVCRGTSHRAPGNPLRAHGRLGAACAIEYAAQAIAIHGALLQPKVSGDAGGFGLLASARDVELLVARLDDIEQELRVSAQRLHSDLRGALYAFALHERDSLLVRGRASLLLDAARATGDGSGNG